jgi:hypothetical protein
MASAARIFRAALLPRSVRGRKLPRRFGNAGGNDHAELLDDDQSCFNRHSYKNCFERCIESHSGIGQLAPQQSPAENRGVSGRISRRELLVGDGSRSITKTHSRREHCFTSFTRQFHEICRRKEAETQFREQRFIDLAARVDDGPVQKHV